jgi:hypothetical protein
MIIEHISSLLLRFYGRNFPTGVYEEGSKRIALKQVLTSVAAVVAMIATTSPNLWSSTSLEAAAGPGSGSPQSVTSPGPLPTIPTPGPTTGPHSQVQFSPQLRPASRFRLNPPSIYLKAGQTIAFQAQVQGTTEQQVEWSLSPGLGSIVNGFYKAPSSFGAERQVTILATSLADPSKTGTAVVLLGQPISIVTPSLPNVTVSIVPGLTTLVAG